MKTMRFDRPQEKITVYSPEPGVKDVIICTNEREVEVKNEGSTETAYEYDGNCFRTFKEINRDMIEADMDYYLDYPGDTAPTQEMVAYANEAVDECIMQLVEAGLL